MFFQDHLTPPPTIATENWQLGSRVKKTLSPGALVIITVPEYRQDGIELEFDNFNDFRSCFYQLSHNDWQIPLIDLGTLILGKTPEDTEVLLEELVKEIVIQQSFPIIIGGSSWLNQPIIKSLQSFRSFLEVSFMDSELAFTRNNKQTAIGNLIADFQYKHLTLLGYQIHQSQNEAIGFIKSMNYECVRLAEMMNNAQDIEPYFRNSDYVGIHLNSIEQKNISLQPQINGLNSREICNYMKEFGLNNALKSLGIFNWNPFTHSPTDFQLLSQMLWYFIDGVNIRRTHPLALQFENYYVLIDDEKHIFLKDTFSNKWYYGNHEMLKCIACSYQDYLNAQNGTINPRLLKPRLL